MLELESLSRDEEIINELHVANLSPPNGRHVAAADDVSSRAARVSYRRRVTRRGSLMRKSVSGDEGITRAR